MSPVSRGLEDGTDLPVLRVAVSRDGVRLWDERAAGATPLLFSHAEWDSFVAGVQRGDFDFVAETLRGATVVPLDDDEP
jgi:hypothetical protein